MSKDYYKLLVRNKAQPPYITQRLQNGFPISTDQSRQVFKLPQSVALESYVKAFQYKVLNSILYTNNKLYKLGFKSNDLCTFCETQSESLYHLLYLCSHSKTFWNDFQFYWYLLSNQQVHPTLQNVYLGIINVTTRTSPLLRLLNYFITIGKLFLWDCKRNQILPKIEGFRHKITSKYETKKPISKKDFINKKWVLIPLLFELI